MAGFIVFYIMESRKSLNSEGALRPQTKLGKWDLLICFLAFFTLASTSFSYHGLPEAFKTKNEIAWDGYGYYVYLPAIFIYKEAGQYNFVSAHREKYEISPKAYQIKTLDNGSKISGYNIGLALLWLPFFLVAHIFASNSALFLADGLSPPYQYAVFFASLFYIGIGLFYFLRLLRRVFEASTARIVFLLILFGTNYFLYAVSVLELTHSYLFSLFAIFLYFVLEHYEKKCWLSFVKMGLILGLMVLVRSSELLLIIIPCLIGFKWKDLVLNPKRELFSRSILFLGLLLLVVSVFSIQLIYFKLTTGYWFVDSYSDRGFDWLSPHLYECFIGFRCGWLIYTPIMVFAIIGIYCLFRMKSIWSWPILVFFVLNSYILFSWDIWWYAASFGSRPVVQSYPLMALPLGAFLVSLRSWKRAVRLSVYCLFILFVSLNLFQSWQYWNNILLSDRVNFAFYKRVFLKTEKNKHDRVLIDVPESKPKSFNRVVESFQSDSSIVLYGKENSNYQEYIKLHTIKIDSENIDRFSGKWLRSTLDVTYTGYSYQFYNMPSVIVQAFREDKALKSQGLGISRVLNNRNRDAFYFDQRLPKMEPGDEVHILLMNRTADKVKFHSYRFDFYSNGD